MIKSIPRRRPVMKDYRIKILSAPPTDWQGFERAYVDEYVWGGRERAHETYGQVVYVKGDEGESGLYARLFCVEKDPISVETEIDGAVCRDSCMEFFFGMYAAAPCDHRYLNIETNSIGVSHVGFGDGRHGRVHLPALGIERFPITAKVGDDGWEVRIFIPEVDLKQIFGLSEIDERTVVLGNFYKCDENRGAPFGSFSPIVAPKPDFHRPECFAPMIMTK